VDVEQDVGEAAKTALSLTSSLVLTESDLHFAKADTPIGGE
jgi:hypothetical protein